MPDSSSSVLCENIAEQVLQEYVLPLRATGGRIPTNRALASRLKVTTGTVAKALHQLRSAGYIQSLVGSGTYVIPAPVRKRQLGIYYGENFFFPRIQDRIYGFIDREFQRQVAEGHPECGIRQYVDTSPSSFSAVLSDDAKNGAVDAVFMVTCDPKKRQAVLDLPVPTIGFNDTFSHGGVFLDVHDFAEQAVRALVQRGCRRLALISPYASDFSSGRFFNLNAGFFDALKREGLAEAPEWSVDAHGDPIDSIEFGREAFHRIWKARGTTVPDGVVVGTDALALGARKAALELGLSIPGDVVIAVAENYENQCPELESCIRFQFHMSEVVSRAVDVLSSADERGPATLFVRSRLASSSD